MEWYHYLAVFFSAVFFSNAVPHLVNGVSGDKFPTPFAKPRGRGLSSPLTNVLWGLLNILIGYILFQISRMNGDNNISLVIFFVGFGAKSVGSAINFQKKDKE
ncbi:MAG: hypothetical protein JST19_08725 [Bacteroidetes bacterium]|nr:hypothetical protein [Bacteroidota bacterium]